MLDVVDFIKDRGGDPNLIRESQRRRHAPEEAVDEVIALFDDHRKGVPPECPPCVSGITTVLTDTQPSTKPSKLAKISILPRHR